MDAWCADNLRGVEAWRECGLPLTVASDEAAKLFDSAQRQLISWTECRLLGGMAGTVKRMLEVEPDFPMGRVLARGLDALGSGHSVEVDKVYAKDLRELVDHARCSKCTEREVTHAMAVDHFGHGHLQSACVLWERILAEHPNDILAIIFLHHVYLFLGDHQGKRDSVARVIDKWEEKNAPWYGYLHGMLAFGLEECGDYEEGIEHGKLALALNRYDGWATHAIAHCLEMRSQFTEGIKLLNSTVEDWKSGNILAGHIHWHQALFHIQGGELETALSIYDKELEERIHGKCPGMLNLTNAASLLTRLELQGIEAGKGRWEDLARALCPHIDDHVLLFNDAHISMAVTRIGDEELMERHRKSIDGFITRGSKENEQARLMGVLGQAICEGVTEFNGGRYKQSFQKLYAIRSQLFRIGGSHAQRDVFTQMLIAAGLRSSDKTCWERTKEVINEREKQMTNSPLTQHYLAAIETKPT